MFGQRSGAFRRVTQVHQHQNVLVLGQAESRRHFLRIEKVQPAAVHAFVRGRQNHVGRHDRRVFHAGIPAAAGIGEHIVPVIGDHQHGGRAVTAGRDRVDPGQHLRRLHHVNMLFLQVLGRRGQPSRLQNGRQFGSIHLLITEFFARVPVFNYFFKFHRVPSPYLILIDGAAQRPSSTESSGRYTLRNRWNPSPDTGSQFAFRPSGSSC